MNPPKISVIIPVYNTEKYLRECLGDTSINLMFGIKKVFDPNLIINPGKVCYPIEGV